MTKLLWFWARKTSLSSIRLRKEIWDSLFPLLTLFWYLKVISDLSLLKSVNDQDQHFLFLKRICPKLWSQMIFRFGWLRNTLFFHFLNRLVWVRRFQILHVTLKLPTPCSSTETKFWRSPQRFNSASITKARSNFYF